MAGHMVMIDLRPGGTATLELFVTESTAVVLLEQKRYVAFPSQPIPALLPATSLMPRSRVCLPTFLAVLIAPIAIRGMSVEL